MIKDGLVKEVQNLLIQYKSFPTAMQGLGYKEVVEYNAWLYCDSYSNDYDELLCACK